MSVKRSSVLCLQRKLVTSSFHDCYFTDSGLSSLNWFRVVNHRCHSLEIPYSERHPNPLKEQVIRANGQLC